MRVGSKKKVGGVSDQAVTGAANLTLRQSLYPVFLVTILFFLWGFAYGLLDVLNKHFQEALDISRARSSGLQGAYFGAYALGPLTYSGWVLRRYGYKATFILGLVIYGVGALMFWPSAVKHSFAGFCGSMFIVGSGLSTLETAANPFIAVCGPPKYSEMRLNLAQAFQGTGTVVAPVLASYVFFANVDNSDLSNVQWVYLGIACFVFCLAVVFYFSSIPEITDADMDDQVRETTGHKNETKIWKERNLLLGVFAQFSYVGAQCAFAGFFINVVTEMNPGMSSATGSKYLSVGQGTFAIGRFLAGAAMKFVKPRYILAVFLLGTIVFSIAAMHAGNEAGTAVMILVLFFESCCFPTIFSLAIRGLGRNTKRGASFVVASICGGAVFPVIMGAVGDMHHSTRYAMCVPLAGFVAAFMYPVYVNLFEKNRMDGFRQSEVGMVHGDVEMCPRDSLEKEVHVGEVEQVKSNDFR